MAGWTALGRQAASRLVEGRDLMDRFRALDSSFKSNRIFWLTFVLQLQAVGEHRHHYPAAGFLHNVGFFDVRDHPLPDLLLRQKKQGRSQAKVQNGTIAGAKLLKFL